MELIDLAKSVKMFLSRMTLLRWLTFLLRSLTMTLAVLLFWIYLFLLTLYLFYNDFPSMGNSNHCLSFHWLFVKLERGSPFHCVVYNYYCADRVGFHDYLRDVSFMGGSGWNGYIHPSSLMRSRLTHLHGFQLLVLLS